MTASLKPLCLPVEAFSSLSLKPCRWMFIRLTPNMEKREKRNNLIVAELPIMKNVFTLRQTVLRLFFALFSNVAFAKKMYLFYSSTISDKKIYFCRCEQKTKPKYFLNKVLLNCRFLFFLQIKTESFRSVRDIL
jgi:hypothetical protein